MARMHPKASTAALWCMALASSTMVSSSASAQTRQAAPTPQASQTPLPPHGASNSDIVVDAQTEREIRERTRAYVRETGVAMGAVAVARWYAPVCPKVLNVAPAAARIVEQKIRATAHQVGIRVAPDQCDPNIVVAFSTDGQELMSIIADSSPRRMIEIGPQARRALEASDAPIRWWHSTNTGAMRSAPVLAPGGASSGTAVTFEGATLTGATGGQSTTGSLIATADPRQINSTAVIIDVNRAEGYSLNAVAAYTAMVALAEIRLESTPQGSILGLFTTNPRPQDLSEADLDFLRALYRIPGARMGNEQQHAIVGRVATAVRRRATGEVEPQR